MTVRVQCQNCGAKVELPAGFAKSRIRCTGCGYYAEVPPDVRAAVEEEASPPPNLSPEHVVADAVRKKGANPVRVKRAMDPRDHRPIFETDEPSGPPLLRGSQDEDDDRPYTVPGTGVKKCPECRGELPLAADLCVHCGLDLAAGGRPDRSYQQFYKVWEAFAPFDKRLLAFVVLQVINVALFLITVVWQGVNALPGITFIAIQVALQAFLVGSYETLIASRDAKGRTQVTKIWRIGFYPMKPAKVPWKTSEGIGIIATHNPGVFEWGTFLYLLLLGCLPGVVFYFLVIRPVRYEIALCDVHGSTDLIIFHTSKQDQADDICRTISEGTGLLFKPVM